MADQNKEPQKSTGSNKLMTLIMVGGIMLLEGGGVFLLARLTMRGPVIAVAESDSGGKQDAETDPQLLIRELEIAEVRSVNKATGKMVTINARVVVLVSEEHFEELKLMTEARKDRLQDRINYVFRSAQPKELTEPNLGSLRRKLKAEFDEVFSHPQKIQDIILPQFIMAES